MDYYEKLATTAAFFSGVPLFDDTVILWDQIPSEILHIGDISTGTRLGDVEFRNGNGISLFSGYEDHPGDGQGSEGENGEGVYYHAADCPANGNGAGCGRYTLGEIDSGNNSPRSKKIYWCYSWLA
jgi:hypothetical protein